MTNLYLFDGYGKIRSDLDTEAATIEALPDDHRTKLFECIAAVKASEAGQDRVATARGDVRQKEAVYNAALAAEQKANPPATHKSALTAVIAANEGRKPVKVKINKETKAKLTDADMALAESRTELNRATGELRLLETKASATILAWKACLTTPTADEVTRQYIKRGDDERVRRVAAGLPAEIPRPVPAHQWEIEKVFANRGKVSANRLPVYRGR